MRLNHWSLAFVLGAMAGLPAWAAAQTGTEFRYQGLLEDAGAPANGAYNIDVTLWDAPVGGSQQGGVVEFNNHPVADGQFTLDIDFGDRMVIPVQMWLQISVDGTELSPRQPISNSPVSIRTRGIHVDPDFDVGIGTAQPGAMLHIDGADTDYGVLRLESPGASAGSIEFNSPRGQMGMAGTAPNGKRRDIWFMDDGLGLFTSDSADSPFAGNGLFITTQGRVGIGTVDPIWDFNVVGNSRFDGAIDVNNSQVRLQDASLRVYGGALLIDSDQPWAARSVSNAVGDAYWAIGFYGQATQTHGGSAGVYGQSASNEGFGLFGIATAAVGTTSGVRGWAESTDGRGVSGYADATSGVTYGVYGESRSPNGAGAYGVSTASSGNAIAVLGQTNSPSGYAAYFIGPAGSRNYFMRNVGIGTTNPAYLLHLGANSAAKPTSDRWTISSDERLKQNITPIDHALGDLLSLRGVTYQWKDPESQGGMGGTYTGMIAQDVEKVFPEWVGEDKNGYKTLTITGFEGVAVEALRELREEKDAEIAALSRRLAQGESEIEQLKRRLAALERAVLMLTATEDER